MGEVAFDIDVEDFLCGLCNLTQELVCGLRVRPQTVFAIPPFLLIKKWFSLLQSLTHTHTHTFSFLISPVLLFLAPTSLVIPFPFMQARLAVNSVVLGDMARPAVLGHFVGEVHNGFRLLTFKNDNLRKRFDGMKYDVKRIEGVVYDLSVRGLAGPRAQHQQQQQEQQQQQ